MTTSPRAPWPAVEALVPHRAPALLLERVVEALDDGLVCRGSIPADGPFAADGRASAFLGLELAAQTAAAFEALGRPRPEAGPRTEGGPRIGYLAAIRDARFQVPELPAGTPLLATVRRLGQAAALAMYSVAVTREDGSELLSATLSTYLLAEPPAAS